MRRVIACLVTVIAMAPVARAQTVQREPTHRIAIVLRVPMLTSSVDLRGPITAQRSVLDQVTRSLLRWTTPPLDEVPLSLAVSPSLCDSLQLAERPDADRLLAALRRLGRRADVLTVPYADAWMPYLPDASSVEEQLELGRAALRSCVRKDVSRTLFAHVLHTGEGEPTQDVDAEAISAARREDIQQVVARGITQTPVRNEDVTVLPFVDVRSVGLHEDGSVREPVGVPRFALVTDVQAPEELGIIERLGASATVEFVRPPQLANEAPRVVVGFPDDPDVPSRYRGPVTRARDAVALLTGVTLDDNPLRTRLKIAFAELLSRTSKAAEVHIHLGEERGTEDLAVDIERFVESELDRVTVSDGSVTFTSRRGTVPVTVANRTSYPVRIRVSLSSPKLTFPNRRTRVVTIRPPGETITFDANARSTGTFPTAVVVKDRNTGVILDRAELTVRSTATNLSALILTGGGAIFLLVFLVRRAGRRRVGRRSTDGST